MRSAMLVLVGVAVGLTLGAVAFEVSHRDLSASPLKADATVDGLVGEFQSSMSRRQTDHLLALLKYWKLRTASAEDFLKLVDADAYRQYEDEFLSAIKLPTAAEPQ